MAKFSDQLTGSHIEFIEAQKMFFVATAPRDGRVNLSPKGLDVFRILGKDRVAYLDLIGSGNETAAHILENGRLTFMFCSFDRNPLILRIYCRGRSILPPWTTASDGGSVGTDGMTSAGAIGDGATGDSATSETAGDGSEWSTIAPAFEVLPGTRQIILGEISAVQTSCGFGVPFYEFVSARDTLVRTAEAHSPEKLLDYQRSHNVRSIDGLPTGLFPTTGNEAGNA
ncbi:MAG: pyridoxamine 5'-phosphate oxidase family protein [Candidatus Eisenbacteria bacterium]